MDHTVRDTDSKWTHPVGPEQSLHLHRGSVASAPHNTKLQSCPLLYLLWPELQRLQWKSDNQKPFSETKGFLIISLSVLLDADSYLSCSTACTLCQLWRSFYWLVLLMFHPVKGTGTDEQRQALLYCLGHKQLPAWERQNWDVQGWRNIDG